MKSWELACLSLSLSYTLIHTKVCTQNCEYVIDTSNLDRFDYMSFDYISFDTLLLSGDSFIIFIDIVYENIKSYKFESFRDSILVTSSYGGIKKTKVITGNFNELNLNPAKVYFVSSPVARHNFNMMIIRTTKGFVQIIPYGTNVQSVLECIENFDNPLYVETLRILKFIREND